MKVKGDAWTEDRCSKLLRKIDTDGDNCISFDEFIAFMVPELSHCSSRAFASEMVRMQTAAEAIKSR